MKWSVSAKELHNKIDKKILKARRQRSLAAGERLYFSFYRYFTVAVPRRFRDEIYETFSRYAVLGRIYVAQEGFNAQVELPKENYAAFVASFQNKEASREYRKLGELALNPALELPPSQYAFYKLVVKVKRKLVNDGLTQPIALSQAGAKLEAEEFNALLASGTALVVDLRNHYESEVGHFKGAKCFRVSTFREQLLEVKAYLHEKVKTEQPVVLYCTGGIRCEKASAYFKAAGIKQVHQLKGGILGYVRAVRERGLDNKFIGKNFVFDGRLGERVSTAVIAKCHQCGVPADSHTNCGNQACHLLFIQCAKCAERYEGCCGLECQRIAALPLAQQRLLRRGKRSAALLAAAKVSKNRFRPWLDPPLGSRSL